EINEIIPYCELATNVKSENVKNSYFDTLMPAKYDEKNQSYFFPNMTMENPLLKNKSIFHSIYIYCDLNENLFDIVDEGIKITFDAIYFTTKKKDLMKNVEITYEHFSMKKTAVKYDLHDTTPLYFFHKKNIFESDFQQMKELFWKKDYETLFPAIK